MRYLEEVVTLELDPSLCNGCRRCLEVCPHAVFAIEERRARIADRGACMECGACARNCESGAVTVRSGVGCAQGILNGILRGTEPSCDCGGGSGSCC
jgi:NAD-dependent dihydropyrimidine dehydrogenase PreA subunit